MRSAGAIRAVDSLGTPGVAAAVGTVGLIKPGMVDSTGSIGISGGVGSIGSLRPIGAAGVTAILFSGSSLAPHSEQNDSDAGFSIRQSGQLTKFMTLTPFSRRDPSSLHENIPYLLKIFKLTCILHEPGSMRGKAGMDSLPKSHYGRFVHPGLPP
jgi:hypothetical protein